MAAEVAYYRSTLRNVLKDIRDDLARGWLAPSWSGVAETIAVVLNNDRPAQTEQQPAYATCNGKSCGWCRDGREPCLFTDAQRKARDAAPIAQTAPQPAEPAPAQGEREAQQCLFVLREIGSMDAEDISGDDVDLRFEDGEGQDTGCDISIVEYAQRSADVIERLLARPAQTAPQGTTSDQYRAELYDEVWQRARDMGYGNVTDALVALERMKAAPQPEQSGLTGKQLYGMWVTRTGCCADVWSDIDLSAKAGWDGLAAALSAQGGAE